jgi:hypothetical protein
MTAKSATQPRQPDLYDSPIQPEEVFWRVHTDNGADTAFGRKLAAERRTAQHAEAVSR